MQDVSTVINGASRLSQVGYGVCENRTLVFLGWR